MIEILKQLNLPADAERWLGDVWNLIQLFDDIEDGDEIAGADGVDVLWSVLVGMPMNPFFLAHQMTLTPIMMTQLLKWQAANEAEAEGEADERSYMWRAGYYDLVLAVHYICFGRGLTEPSGCAILSLYGESYSDYKKEFEDA